MDGGLPRSRILAGSRAWWRTPVRTGAAACLVALLVGVLIGSGRPPTTEVAAHAAAPQAPPAAPPTTPPVTLPRPTERQVNQPASLSSPTTPTVVAGVSGIPDVALAAYQRSAVVMGAAAPSCGIDWALLAAIGQVESDHGQANGSHLDQNGVARPAIVGLRLDGRHGTSRIDDTDAGRLDGDDRFDRAVGPMQFLPSTWAAVAVDGDDDGHRDVQDIDDAALGSAVYLCADHDDLATKAGQRRAVLRYNHSRAYADRVLSIADELRAGSVVAPLDSTTVQSVSSLSDLPEVGLKVPDGHRHHGNPPGSDASPPQPTATMSAQPNVLPTGTPAPSDTPTTDPTDPPTTDPTDPPTTDPTDPPTTDPPTTDPTDPPTTDPTDPPTTDPTGPPTEEPVLTDPLPDELVDLTPEQVETYNAAWAVCDDDLVDGWSADTDTVAALTECLAEEIGVPTSDAQLLTFVDWLARNEDGAIEEGVTEHGITE